MRRFAVGIADDGDGMGADNINDFSVNQFNCYGTSSGFLPKTTAMRAPSPVLTRLVQRAAVSRTSKPSNVEAWMVTTSRPFLALRPSPGPSPRIPASPKPRKARRADGRHATQASNVE
ncbi:hypothetical protein NEUTE2DRAFT_133820 [Neurospora tetrasperma FGSC 2509]|nr:hypothetical protein NEUTE2DRAFT_133820 [Neurospora tetrasperma FGSC 2509]